MRVIIKTRFLVYSILLGTLILVAGIILGFRVFPSFVEKKVWEKSILKENTSQWDVFMKTPFPFDFKIYIFNVENVEEILEGAKPIVREVGPYVYKINRWKSDINWDSDEISYYEYSHYEFNKELSGKLSDDDFVTVLNAPFNSLILTVEEISADALPSLYPSFSGVFKEKNDLFIKIKVKDFLFEGFKICENFGDGDFTVEMICKQVKEKLKITKSMWLQDNSIYFANFRFRNESHLGRFTIKSGQKNREQLNDLVRFNNQSFIPVWNGEKSLCNQIRGTTTFHPYVLPDMKFEVFGEDICRTLTMLYNKTELIKGIKGLKYTLQNDSFMSPKENSQDYCFCVNRTRGLDGNFGCLGDGLMDMTTCLGAPIILSLPHLLNAEKYRNFVDGLHPDAKKHENFVILEPTSGVPLAMAKRVQFNMFLRAIEGVTSIENVTNAIIPLFWVEESMVLSDQYVNLLKSSLLNKLQIIELIKWGLIGFASVSINVSLLLIVFQNQ